ncbi:protein of unknown function [Vreelandella subterranea]|uniref:DUF4868 domain-containing protein n=1 Tax=Vreelandella subterranea TaxID=416874 RepID=A0A1H9U650_9GAMM|nr:Kiwa anti-phage protein KwaB-like domain-containing protein [Halomonas subterranea]SES04637.1 protein of unknown function [Halomonas subterranea]
MFEDFQLAAIVKGDDGMQLRRIPLHQTLQTSLSGSWASLYQSFVGEITEIDFNAGYKPELHERFSLSEFALPDWIADETTQSVPNLDAITTDDALLEAMKGVVAFVQNSDGEELLLFQNFSRSHVIQPGRFLFLQNNTYETPQRPGLALDKKISAVYSPADEKLLFQNFRTVNTFLPLADFYEEATEQQIREVLNHELLAPEDVDSLATGANQWFRTRFAMLNDSDVLNAYSATEILARSNGYDVDIHLENEQIVFPAEKAAAKKLLQFLNEELFRGAITETLYETNSKREAD